MKIRLLNRLRIVFLLICLSGGLCELAAQNSPVYFSLRWTNDIMYLPNQTDHYYTNGVNFELSLPAFTHNPLNYTLLKAGKKSHKIYSLGLIQDIFTPIRTDTIGLLLNDRPFASFLTIQSSAISIDPARSLRIHAEWQLGIIGKPAGGGGTQNLIHKVTPNDEVLGWSNQVRTDAVINYNVKLEKGLFQSAFFQSWLGVTARLGTLYTDLTPGIHMRLGLFDDRFGSPLGWEGKKKINAFLYGSASLRMLAYDATLEGGLFRADERYRNTIQPHRLQEQWELGLELSYSQFSIQLGVKGNSPEFTGGQNHHWGYIGLRILN